MGSDWDRYSRTFVDREDLPSVSLWRVAWWWANVLLTVVLATATGSLTLAFVVFVIAFAVTFVFLATTFLLETVWLPREELGEPSPALPYSIPLTALLLLTYIWTWGREVLPGLLHDMADRWDDSVRAVENMAVRVRQRLPPTFTQTGAFAFVVAESEPDVLAEAEQRRRTGELPTDMWDSRLRWVTVPNHEGHFHTHREEYDY